MTRAVCWGLTALALLMAQTAGAASPELVVQTGHTALLVSASFSPDGRRIVTASGDSTAIIWDADAGKQLRTLDGHYDILSTASFSPDGRRVITASRDLRAIVWDAATGAKLLTLAEHLGPVTGASFSPDGRRVATASFDKTAIIWDAATGAKLLALVGHKGPLTEASFSPDGRRVVTTSWDETAIIWDAASGEKLLTFNVKTGVVASASFSLDGRRVATASGITTVWDAATGAKLLALVGHKGPVSEASFSPDGRRVVTASFDGTAIIWDAATGAKIRALDGHEGGLASVSFSPDGRLLAAASPDKTAIVWDTATGEKVRAFAGHTSRVWSASFSPDGRRVVTSSSDKTARIWNAATGENVRTLVGHTHEVSSASFSPDGRRVVTTSWDKTAVIWDSATGAKLRALAGHSDAVRSASFSPDGRRVATASYDRTAVIWDAATGRKILGLTGHLDRLNSASFSPDGRRVVTASFDGTAIIWDAATGAKIRALDDRMGWVNLASFSPDSRRVITASDDETAIVWDAATGRKLLTLDGHTNRVSSASFSPDGRHVVTASSDDTIGLWNIATGEKLASLISINYAKDWLVVTPKGLFDGSLGGREKVSYRVGDGLTVVPVDRFFQDFYYPGLLTAIFRGERPMPKADFATLAAPTVRFVAPASDATTGQGTAEVVVEVVDNGGGIQGPSLYQNGTRLLSAVETRKVGPATRRTFRVRLVEGVNRLEAKAASGDGGWEAEPARVVLTYDRPPVRPDLWVLSVGVDAYADDRIRLKFAGADAKGFGEVFGRRGEGLYAAVHVTTLLDGKATRAGLADAMGEVAAKAQPRDTFILTVSGHGTTLGQRYYFLPHEFRSDRFATLEENVKKQGIPIDELGEMLGKVPALKKVLILDTCGSGGATGLLQKGRNPFAFRGAIERMNRTQGLFTIAACASGEEAQESKELGHGLLSYALLAGLRSVDGGPLEDRGVQPSNAEQVADVLEWFNFAAGQAPGLSKRYFGREQDVHMATSGNSFPILPVRDR